MYNKKATTVDELKENLLKRWEAVKDVITYNDRLRISLHLEITPITIYRYMDRNQIHQVELLEKIVIEAEKIAKAKNVDIVKD